MSHKHHKHKHLNERATATQFLAWFYCHVDLEDSYRDELKRQFKLQSGLRLPDGYHDPDEEEHPVGMNHLE